MTRFNAQEYAAIVKRLRLRVRRRFPLNCQVRLSRKGLRHGLFLRKGHGPLGTVVGYSAGISPNVLWDGRRTPAGYAPEFVSRVRMKKRKDKT
jgi:hypothetical protein